VTRRFPGILVFLLGTILAPGPAAHAAPSPEEEPRWFGADPGEGTVPYPYIAEPIDSWVNETVEREIALGNLRGIPAHIRPHPRALLAQRVAEAYARGRRSVGLERLARELAWEARFMGLDLPFRDTRPWLSFGPAASHVKFNGLIRAGGRFEEGEPPDLGTQSLVGFRGVYWGPGGLSLLGEFFVNEHEGAARFGNVVFQDSDIQYNPNRFVAKAHGRFWEVWFGREHARWGPGRSGGLLLGGTRTPFGQFGYTFHLGDFITATAVHAWLSAAEGRYAAYHRAEFNPGKGLRLGLAEGVRYDRSSPDPLYLVNLITYAAVERLNTLEGSPDADGQSLFRSNVLASADFYWRFAPGTAAYGELMVDDFNDRVSPTRMAYQLGARQEFSGRRRLLLQAEYTRVYNYTYSVYYGRDFEHAGEPLGYPAGPDVADLNLWADLDLNLEWSVGVRAFHRRSGEGTLGSPWCPETLADLGEDTSHCQTVDNRASGREMAGVVETRTGFSAGPTFSPRDNLRLEIETGIVVFDDFEHVPGAETTRLTARAAAAWRW
jgi:hypothetical protein